MADPIGKITAILGVAGSITTLISLAALSILVAFLLARQWLAGKRFEVREAISRRDNEKLALVLGGRAGPLNELDAQGQLTLAMEDLRTRSRLKIVSYALIFFTLLAILVFASVIWLFSNKNDNIKKLDIIQVLDILRIVPVPGRLAACQKLMPARDCENATALILALDYEQASETEAKLAQETLREGGVPESRIAELAVCGGRFAFRVNNDRLECTDGNPIPFAESGMQGASLEQPVAVVLHYTGTSGNTSLTSLANLLANGREQLPGPLAHFLVSKSGAVVQVSSLRFAAKHVGRAELWQGEAIGNRNSIAIEMINSGDGESYPQSQLEAVEGIARALVSNYNIKYIVGHSDLAPRRKRDPGPNFPIGRIRSAAGVES